MITRLLTHLIFGTAEGKIDIRSVFEFSFYDPVNCNEVMSSHLSKSWDRERNSYTQYKLKSWTR